MNNIKIIDNEINSLITGFSIRKKEDIILSINTDKQSDVKSIGAELGLNYKDINLNKEKFYNGLSRIRKLIINNNVSMVIVYDVVDLGYPEVSILSSTLFNLGIREVILVKGKSKDKEILKSFLMLYEPYRTIKKSVLLRRCSSYEYMHYF